MEGFTLFGLVSLVLIHGVLAADPTVDVAEGRIMGKTITFSENQFINVTKDLDLFLGVPFADPPQRFKPPTPKTQWEGTLNVTDFSSACPQAQDMLSAVEVLQSEDCLYLNVYSPSPKPTNAAVMVWVHGGSFTTGTASDYTYYGVPLVAVGDVIVVTINYRLGVFAKLTTGDAEAPGNVGMLDQVAALQWVYNNIAEFGGDKDKITLFGESAGAASVEFHMLSPLSRGLFNQVITESGTSVASWAFDHRPLEDQTEDANNLGLTLGCDVSSSSALIACLSTTSIPEIIIASQSAYGRISISVDGNFLRDKPFELYQRGDFKRCPILSGVNKDEGTIFSLIPAFPVEVLFNPRPPSVNLTTLDSLLGFVMLQVGVNDDIGREAALHEYADWSIADNPAGDQIKSLTDATGDALFACPTDYVLRKHAQVGDQVFKYYMPHVPSRSVFSDAFPHLDTAAWFGAAHGEDIAFVFGWPFTAELPFSTTQPLTNEEKTLSVKVMTFWTNFAKTGDPSKSSADADPGEGVDSWPLYTIPELKHKEISLELGQGRALKARQCNFWNELLPKLQAFIESKDNDPTDDWQESFMRWQTDTAEWKTAFEDYKESRTCN